MTLLVLFDVDGTLLLSHDDVYVDANRAALEAVFGTDAEAPDVPGDTATAATRRALRLAGIAEHEIDERLEAWCDDFSRRYVELLGRTDTSHWRVPSNAAATLARVERRALLTGNPEPVARARMERIGLAELFAKGQGAFGCEREARLALIDLALSRAGDWPAAQTVTVGDTPLDVESAHTAGARCVAVTSGRYDAEDLAGADAVVARLSDVPEALGLLAV